jgi:hypothetical protein
MFSRDCSTRFSSTINTAWLSDHIWARISRILQRVGIWFNWKWCSVAACILSGEFFEKREFLAEFETKLKILRFVNRGPRLVLGYDLKSHTTIPLTLVTCILSTAQGRTCGVRGIGAGLHLIVAPEVGGELPLTGEQLAAQRTLEVWEEEELRLLRPAHLHIRQLYTLHH